MSSHVRTICLPSSDRAFAAAVEAALSQGDLIEPKDLARRLSAWAPHVVVRSRDLSGEDAATWYVYRDGRFAAEQDADWHHAAGTPWARFDAANGLVLDANDAFAELVGFHRANVIGTPYQTFVFPEAVELANRVYAEIVRTGEAHSVVQLRRKDGSSVTVEFVARSDRGSVEGWYRPVTLARL